MQDDNNAPWQYKPDGDQADAEDLEPAAAPDTRPNPKNGSVAWQGVEFIEHPHNAAWYGALIFLTAALTGFVYFVTKDYIATGTIPIVGIIVGVFAKHKPGVVEYEISDSGLKVGQKNYPYGLFKSFSVLQEGSLKSVNLFPLKRFMPPIAAYFDPPDQDKIVDALGDHLPYEERKMDKIDLLSRRLRL
jgi:hypothetical protein